MRVQRSVFETSWVLAAVALSMTALVAPARAAADDGKAEMPADRELATEARLSTILRVIVERSPDLREASERMHAAEARTGASARLPDPELKSELWGVPLTHPLSFDQANTIMIGLRQSFPAWGSLDARERAARERAAREGAEIVGLSLTGGSPGCDSLGSGQGPVVEQGPQPLGQLDAPPVHCFLRGSGAQHVASKGCQRRGFHHRRRRQRREQLGHDVPTLDQDQLRKVPRA